MRYTDRLVSDLTAAVEAGIITADQSGRVQDLIRERYTHSRIRGVAWIAIFAGLSIVAGISLIVAHNWESIPAWGKVLGFLALLIASGIFSLKTQEQTPAIRIPVELLWFFLPIIGIGLYAQVFQLSGDPVRPFLVWIALTLPLAWVSSCPATPPIHVAAMLITLIWGSLSRNQSLSLTAAQSLAVVRPQVWILLPALVGLSMWESRRRLRPTHQVYAIGALLAWAYFIMAADTPFRAAHEALLSVAAVSASIIWLIAARGIRPAEQSQLPRCAWVLCVYFMTFFWHYKSDLLGFARVQPAGCVLVGLLGVLAALLLVAAPAGLFSSDQRWERAAKAVLAVSGAMGLVLLNGSVPMLKLVAVAANVILVIVGVGLMWHGSLAADVAQINGGVATLFLLLITRFIDVFGSMLQGGLAFIVAGVVLLVIAYGLHRSRQAMIELAQGGKRL